MSSSTLLLIASSVFILGIAEGVIQKLTYYWVVHENEFRLGSDVRLNTCSGKNLARTSKEFADRIAIEGSGYLRDGKTVLSLSSCISNSHPCKSSNGKYNCFERVKAPVGSRDNALVPLVSIASNDIPYGTTGVIKELVGKKTPRGETHNGCVRVDDSCSTCNKRNWIDFYAFEKKNYDYFNKNWGLSSVDFQKQSCTPKKYKV